MCGEEKGGATPLRVKIKSQGPVVVICAKYLLKYYRQVAVISLLIVIIEEVFIN